MEDEEKRRGESAAWGEIALVNNVRVERGEGGGEGGGGGGLAVCYFTLPTWCLERWNNGACAIEDADALVNMKRRRRAPAHNRIVQISPLKRRARRAVKRRDFGQRRQRSIGEK